MNWWIFVSGSLSLFWILVHFSEVMTFNMDWFVTVPLLLVFGFVSVYGSLIFTLFIDEWIKSGNKKEQST